MGFSGMKYTGSADHAYEKQKKTAPPRPPHPLGDFKGCEAAQALRPIFNTSMLSQRVVGRVQCGVGVRRHSNDAHKCAKTTKKRTWFSEESG